MVCVFSLVFDLVVFIEMCLFLRLVRVLMFELVLVMIWM